jgi:AbiV family abortive infection protein
MAGSTLERTHSRACGHKRAASRLAKLLRLPALKQLTHLAYNVFVRLLSRNLAFVPPVTMKPIAAADLKKARALVLANATELLEDALFLLNDGRYARSYAITVLAREEMAKLAMVVRAVYALNDHEQFDWDRFYRRIKKHEAKLEVFALVEIIISTNLSQQVDKTAELRRLLSEPENRRKLNEGKQDGFYVSVAAEGVRLPSDVISDELARSLYHRTRTMLEFFRSGEETDPDTSVFAGITDPYGKIICLAEDFIESPDSVVLPR